MITEEVTNKKLLETLKTIGARTGQTERLVALEKMYDIPERYSKQDADLIKTLASSLRETLNKLFQHAIKIVAERCFVCLGDFRGDYLSQEFLDNYPEPMMEKRTKIPLSGSSTRTRRCCGAGTMVKTVIRTRKCRP